MIKAIRGAIDVKENTKEAIFDAAEMLVTEIIRKNELNEKSIVNIMFTMTQDLSKAFPSQAVRERIRLDVPLIDLEQKYVEGAMKKCLRVMMLVDTQKEIKHIYLGKAVNLRKDIGGKNDSYLKKRC